MFTPSTGASGDVVGAKYDQTVAKPVGRFDVHPAAFSWRHTCLKSTVSACSADPGDACAETAAAFVLVLVLTVMCAVAGKFSNGREFLPCSQPLIIVVDLNLRFEESRSTVLTLALFLQ